MRANEIDRIRIEAKRKDVENLFANLQKRNPETERCKRINREFKITQRRNEERESTRD